MNLPSQSTTTPTPHLTRADLDRALLDSTAALNFSMLQCSSEDCLIATHEFDTSPSTGSSEGADQEGLPR